MRALILTAMTVLVGGPALASSIQPIVGTAVKGGSIVEMTCQQCPAPKPKEELTGYRVPSLPTGTQEIEVKDVDGQKKVLRTEAWMGGSPVTFVSTAPIWIEEEARIAAAEKGLPAGHDGIDTSAQTAAVVTADGTPTVAATAGSITDTPPLDTTSFTLRLH